ncbi:MAG: ribose 5-phosphate isomerase B [Candidatus Hydrogenedentota bacterium]
MKIAFGSDHAGYEGPPPLFKPALMEYMASIGHEVVDCGAHGPEPVDYPDFANCVAEAVVSGKADEGVLLCGTGMGVCMAANRHKGVRAAVCMTEEMVQLAREHNNANVLCLGRRTMSLDACKRMIDAWFRYRFSGADRHVRRVQKMG